MKRTRNEYDIIADILKFCSAEPKIISKINRICYLTNPRERKLVGLLVEKGLLCVVAQKKKTRGTKGPGPHLMYRTTQKGKEYLEAYAQLQYLLEKGGIKLFRSSF